MTGNFFSLDLSSKPGWAFFRVKESQIESLKYDTLFPDKSVGDFGKYPFNYVKFSDHIAAGVLGLIQGFLLEAPDLEVIIEETNAGRNNYSQKMLEFIHYGVIRGCSQLNIPIKYIRTGVWRRLAGANLNQEEKNLNAKIRRIKKSSGLKLAKIDGKVVGKRTSKHAAVRAFNDYFGQELPLKMEDACEAVLLGLAYMKGAKICDGTTTGGTGS